MTFLERLGAELEGATAGVAAERAPTPGEGRAAPPPAPLGAHSVLRYAVVEGAERYRRIMRVLCTEHRNFGLRLSPEAVGERLREAFELELDPLAIASHLDQLHTWGAVTREYDTALARTAQELRRNRFTYDISPAGKRTEELLEALDQLGATVGALEGSRLPAIRDALRRIARLLDAEDPSGVELRREFESLTGEIERLHAGASDFMSSLNVVILRSEQIDEAEFDRCKGVLIEHLEGFRAALRRHSDEIVEALRTVDRLGAEPMVALIVSELELPELPDLTREQLAAQRHRELHGQWLGVRSWFVDEGGRSSPWAALNAKIVDAIRAVLDIAERIVDQRANRADRARACEHLARLVHDAPTDEQAIALVAAAIGFVPPRHVSVPEEDPEAVAHAGSTGWLGAPPAPVVAHLRRPGMRMPGAGSGASIRSADAARALLRKRARREREEFNALLGRLSGRGQVRLSALAGLGEGEFRHLLGWIGSAFETPASPSGVRRAESRDGRAEVLLHAPGRDAPRVQLRVPQGRFDAPDYVLEVRAR